MEVSTKEDLLPGLDGPGAGKEGILEPLRASHVSLLRSFFSFFGEVDFVTDSWKSFLKEGFVDGS